MAQRINIFGHRVTVSSGNSSMAIDTVRHKIKYNKTSGKWEVHLVLENIDVSILHNQHDRGGIATISSQKK